MEPPILSKNLNGFIVGDSVQFTYRGHEYKGLVQRVSRKTISILTTNNEEWRVSPGGLTLIFPLTQDDLEEDWPWF